MQLIRKDPPKRKVDSEDTYDEIIRRELIDAWNGYKKKEEEEESKFQKLVEAVDMLTIMIKNQKTQREERKVDRKIQARSDSDACSPDGGDQSLGGDKTSLIDDSTETQPSSTLKGGEGNKTARVQYDGDEKSSKKDGKNDEDADDNGDDADDNGEDGDDEDGNDEDGDDADDNDEDGTEQHGPPKDLQISNSEIDQEKVDDKDDSSEKHNDNNT